MKIIEIEANELGGHQNQFTNFPIPVPEGWAEIPEWMTIPDTFPFVNITVKNGKVKTMSAGTVPPPEPEPVPPDPETDVWDEMAEAIRGGVNSVE